MTDQRVDIEVYIERKRAVDTEVGVGGGGACGTGIEGGGDYEVTVQCGDNGGIHADCDGEG